jgi:hypothetical protein
LVLAHGKPSKFFLESLATTPKGQNLLLLLLLFVMGWFGHPRSAKWWLPLAKMGVAHGGQGGVAQPPIFFSLFSNFFF